MKSEVRYRGINYRVNQRRSHYKANYNTTIEELEKLVLLQESKCKVCGTTRSFGGRTGLHVDHDHDTGKIRGLLCHKCNSAIGMLREDINIVERLFKYLKGEL